MIRSSHSFFIAKFRDKASNNVRPISTIVLSTFPHELSMNHEIKGSRETYRENRIQFNTMLEKYWTSGFNKCSQGKHSSGLVDFQKILAFMNNEKVTNLTQKQTLLLAKVYTESAKVLSVGTVYEENIALEYLDKAIELAPGLENALNLKRSILSGNSISPNSFVNVT